MTSREKRFEKIILAQEKYYPYPWIQNFLEYYGYMPRNPGSSHIIFRRENYERVTIVTHHNKVKRVYVKQMLKVFKKENIL